jgi:replicative DNA helicase
VWVTAGAGSVLLVWGKAGDSVVELTHLKQPVDDIGPLQVLHDHHQGSSRITRGGDPLDLVVARPGITAPQVASAVYVPDGSRQPKQNEIEKARRQLEGLVRKGLVHRRNGIPTTSGGAPAIGYYAAHGQPESTHGAPTEGPAT